MPTCLLYPAYSTTIIVCFPNPFSPLSHWSLVCSRVRVPSGGLPSIFGILPNLDPACIRSSLLLAECKRVVFGSEFGLPDQAISLNVPDWDVCLSPWFGPLHFYLSIFSYLLGLDFAIFLSLGPSNCKIPFSSDSIRILSFNFSFDFSFDPIKIHPTSRVILFSI